MFNYSECPAALYNIGILDIIIYVCRGSQVKTLLRMINFEDHLDDIGLIKKNLIVVIIYHEKYS